MSKATPEIIELANERIFDKKYRIEECVDTITGKPRVDKFYPHIKTHWAVIQFFENLFGCYMSFKLKHNGHGYITSHVNDIEFDNDKLTVTTENTVYIFREIVQENKIV